MFILTTLKHTLPLPPQTFHLPSHTALTDALNALYAHKTLWRIGHCLCIWDIVSAGDAGSGFIGSTTTVHSSSSTTTLLNSKKRERDGPTHKEPTNDTSGHGTAFATVTFRALVFRPFKGEVLEGVLEGSDRRGLRVGLGFYWGVWVPAPEGLFVAADAEGEAGGSGGGAGNVKDESERTVKAEEATTKAQFDPHEKRWYWLSHSQRYYFDHGERVRVRVEDELWSPHSGTLTNPPPRSASASDSDVDIDNEEEEREDEDEEEEEDIELGAPRGRYTVLGSMKQSGLGLVSWWGDEEDDDEGDGNGEAMGE